MRSRRSLSRVSKNAAVALCVPAMIFAGAGTASAEPAWAPASPVKVPKAIATANADASASVAPSLRKATGTVTVSVTLSEKALAATVTEGAMATRSLPSRSRQRGQTSDVKAQQDRMIAQAKQLGGKAVGRATRAANVVAMTIPAKNLTALSELAGVVSVKPVARYETHADPGGSGSLAQAAEYVQATSVRAAGYDGTGVKVAVLDSGIDYTHSYLGGPGTEAAYADCYTGAGKAYDSAPTGACAALFGPSAPKVKGGYDFVGETWPTTAEVPDPNPIDLEGHGTHVADIIGGKSADGTHAGIAPGVDLYAVKVCSAVATSCSGVALLQGVDWALDPNGDGDISDAMDVVNLSLGQAYGQDQDDLTTAVDNLVRAGVVAVVSAGNSADRPFIVGSPSTAPRAISVAQTALPDDQLYQLAISSPTIPAIPGNVISNLKLQSWSPAPTASLAANLAQPNGNREGCTAGTFAGFPSGAVALVKRGSCSASVKSQLAQDAGASAVVIWNNVPGDPPDFSFGGGAAVTVPTYTASFDDGNALSSAVTAGTVAVSIDPSRTTKLANTTVGTSSRGSTATGQRAKPDIGAPGAWLSAEVGTGDGQTNFGGTSGAAPVVSGAAALVLDRYPSANPTTVKARLLNGASTANKTPDARGNLYATPITRIGAGELRVAPAVDNQGVLRLRNDKGGNVGLGLPHLTTKKTYTVKLRIANTSKSTKRYLLSPEFRDPADKATKALTVKAPSVVRVPARGVKDFSVKVTIDPAKLKAWPFTHAAGYTGDGAELNGPELDGYLRAVSTDETLHLGWTVLPHASADVSAPSTVRLSRGTGKLALTNASKVLDGGVNVFGLTGTSPKQAKPAAGQPGSAGSNVALIDLAAVGVRDDLLGGVVQFAIAGHQRQTVPLYPAGYEVDVDTNRDGTADYAVYQAEAVGFGSSGQSLVFVVNIATGVQTPYYYTDADFDSATQVLTAPLAALGLKKGSTFDFSVVAYDNYFSGLVTDAIVDQTWTVGSSRYGLASNADGLLVPAGRTSRVNVTENTSAGTSTQTGLLLFFDDAKSRDAQAVQVTGGTPVAVTSAQR